MVTDTRVEVDWSHELVDQLDFHWNVWFRPRLEGLTDEEFLWEPVADCWSVRPGADGVWRLDGHADPDAVPSPPPFTTIAWRLGHIGADCLGMRAADHFGDAPYDPAAVRWPTTAAEGIAFVEDAYARWKAGVAALGADGLHRSCGPAEGPFADHPMAALVLHINREVIHHGAEVACLRDLYAHRGDRWP
jgi:hypothetical protein